jgi:hypothetical protein
VGDNVLINSKTLLVTDFVNLKIKPVQSFEIVHRDRVYMRMFIGVSTHTCMSICVCTVFLKKIASTGLSFNFTQSHRSNPNVSCCTTHPGVNGSALVITHPSNQPKHKSTTRRNHRIGSKRGYSQLTFDNPQLPQLLRGRFSEEHIIIAHHQHLCPLFI